MDVAWLEVFGAVARTGSFTAAGVELGYTQSAVSRQIAALEREFGAELFERLPRGVRLTEEGRYLLAHADAVLDRLGEAHRELLARRELTAGRLRVGAFATADAALVPRALAAFRAAYPKIGLGLTEGLTPDLLARLRADEIDVAVVSGYRGLNTEGLAVRHLLDDPVLVALPAGHPLEARAELRLADLVDESWIAGSARPEETLMSDWLRAGLRPRIDFVVREWTAKLGFVAAGLGLTLVPALAAGAVRPDVVVRPLHADDAPVRAVSVVTRHASTRAAELFIASLVESAATLRPE